MSNIQACIKQALKNVTNAHSRTTNFLGNDPGTVQIAGKVLTAEDVLAYVDEQLLTAISVL